MLIILCLESDYAISDIPVLPDRSSSLICIGNHLKFVREMRLLPEALFVYTGAKWASAPNGHILLV